MHSWLATKTFHPTEWPSKIVSRVAYPGCTTPHDPGVNAVTDGSSRHKADMLSAAAGNKTYLSPNVIKWSGFQLIGESLLSVLQCRNHPYNLGEGDEKLKRSILETPDISEQVIFSPPPHGTGNRVGLTFWQELDAKSHEHEPPVKRTYSKSQSTGSQWFGKTFRGR